MSLLISPGQLSRRAHLYQQLSQLTAAGIGLVQALEIQQRSPPSPSFRRPLAIAIQQLSTGSTFHEAFSSTGRWLPEFDAALLRAGEQSGRLPACFTLLAAHYESSAGLLRKTISSLLYPALLFHMAVMIAPLPELFKSWDLFAYFARTLGILVPVYALLFGLVYATQGAHGERWRSAIERVLRCVPVLGQARLNLALARLSSALEALLAAGVSIVEAWDLAGAASGSPALRRAVLAWKPEVLAGVTPAEAVTASGAFPDVFCNLYRTGEVTGSLEDTLRRLHIYYQDEGSRQLKAVADWTPKLVYFGVAILVGWQVIKFWTGYFDQINKAIGP
jgi:type II secretory pathway component PulF